MDRLRGLAIVLVVLFHAATVLARFVPDVPDVLQPPLAFFAPFRMPLLMFLSGVLLHVSLAKPSRAYLAGKVRALAWPYVVWSLVFLAVAGQLSAGRAVALAWETPPHLWYLTHLLMYYVAAWAAVRLRVPLLVLVVASFLATIAPIGDNRFYFLFCFFAAGHLYHQHARPLGRAARRTLLAVTAAVVTIGGAASVARLDLKYETEYVLVPVAGIALSLLLAPGTGNGWPGRALAYVGRHSMVFYVTHFPAQWGVYRLLDQAGVQDGLLLYGTGVSTGLLVGVAVVELARRRPAVNALFRLPAHAPGRTRS